MPKAVGGWKICSECREKKPVSEFSKCASHADGLCYPCKECYQDYQQSEKGRASKRGADQRYHASEGGKATQRRYNQTKKGKAADQRYKQSAQGKVVHQGSSARYRRSAKGKVVHRRARYKRRARKVEVVSNVSSGDLKVLFARHPVCNYCAHEFSEDGGPFKRTLDHIVPLSRGGQDTFDNLVYACSRCNSQKGTKLPEEWDFRWYEQEGVEVARLWPS